MIQTRGFASSKIDSLTDEIDRWMMSNTQVMDTDLIPASKGSVSSGLHSQARALGRMTYS